MIKITVMPHTKFTEDGEEKGFGVIRENGSCLFHCDYETDAVLHAWQLVKKYGLTMVEPW